MIVCLAASDEEESDIARLLAENVGDCVPPHRSLYHETLIGKIAIVRQVKSDVHIDGVYVPLILVSDS